MAKSKTPVAAKTAAAAPAAKTAPKTEAPAVEEKVSLAKMRGPRGVAETAKITVISTENPKRTGSKAHDVFSLYEDGMTVGQFCDAVNATKHNGLATVAMVYDAKHGFISIEGYDPGEIVAKAPKEPKAPKDASTPKEPKAPKGKVVAKPKVKAKADEEAEEETID
jgi:hypothetical protein